MTAPSGATGPGFLSSTGLAAFAAKTRTDWENEQRAAFTASFADAEDGFGVIKDWIDTLISLLTTEAQGILTDLFSFFGDVFTGAGSVVTWLENLGSAALSAALAEFDTFISGITNRTAWLTTFKTLIDGLLGITNFSTWVGVFKKVINTLVSVTSIDAWLVVFKKIIDFFVGVTSIDAWLAIFKKVIDALVGITNIDNWLSIFKSIVDTFVTVVGSLGQNVWTVLNEIITYFTGLFTGAGSIATWLGNVPGNLLTVISTITGQAVTTLQDGLTKLTQFTQGLPNSGSLISGLLGSYKNPATGTNNTLPDLVAWASRLLTSSSVVPSWNLFGSIPEELLALIGVGNIGNVQPNLVNDAAFSSSEAFQAGQGWTWDGATNASGSSGGSAKLTCDGGVKYLYSNLIPATAGQQLTVSTSVKWTKGSTANATMICGVRIYNGASVLATTTVAQLAATGTSGGFTPITGTYTVPASTTHVRLVLGVTTGTAGTSVWFDEASLKKTSLLGQGLVSGLETTISDLLPQGTFKTLLDTVAQRTGATVQQVQDVINGKYKPGDPLNGLWITAGNISSAFIEELRKTWSATYGSVVNGDPFGAVGYQDLANALAGWGRNFTALQSQISELAGTVNIAKNAADGVALRATNLENRMAAAELKLSTPVTPPVTAPVIVSVLDDFERSSLGANWTVNYSGANGSTLGIPNAHDAQYVNPVTTVENRVAAIWVGTGRTSLSEYQRIYTTLGSKAVVPGPGSITTGTYPAGFNDLIGRAVDYKTCLICRFFGNGTVQFLYRQNSWTDVSFGTFTIPVPPTTGTGLEFYCGDKSVNDQTKLYAKIGSTIIGPAYVSAAVLASMGKGWGFGMGHAISIANPLSAGIINYWGGQDQV